MSEDTHPYELVIKCKTRKDAERILTFLKNELSICNSLDYSIEISKCIDKIKSLEG